MSKVPVMVHAIPDNIREAVERDASERDVSLTYAVGSVVASALGMSWTGAKGYPFRGTTSPGAKWVIQFPVEIKVALQERAREEGAAMARLIVAFLAEAHGLPIPSPKDRRSISQPRDEGGRFGQSPG
jgi:hypothetical protein